MPYRVTLMNLRAATPADAPVLADAWHAMLGETGLLLAEVDPHWREWTIEDFRAGIGIGAQAWLLVEDEGTMVACGAAFFRAGRASCALTGMSAMIAGIYTLPPYRHRGFARTITERLLEICRTRGCKTVRLRASAAGRPLYESLGFVSGDEMVCIL
jgi:GNAT superfamily N-acetyltransferase